MELLFPEMSVQNIGIQKKVLLGKCQERIDTGIVKKLRKVQEELYYKTKNVHYKNRIKNQSQVLHCMPFLL